MNRPIPTLAAPFYTDGVGLRRCHFCLNLETRGHEPDCRVLGPTGAFALNSTDDVAPGSAIDTPTDLDIDLFSRKGHLAMFTENTPMTLKDVTFTTEVIDDETRRVVICTFGIAPFTNAHAEALNVKSLLFDSAGQPKPAIDGMDLRVACPAQRLEFAMSPDQGERRIMFPEVLIDPKVKVKVKRDREPASCEATLKVRFNYPTAEELMYIANGVNDTHYLTFTVAQPPLNFAAKAEDTRAPMPKRPAGKPNGAEAHA